MRRNEKKHEKRPLIDEPSFPWKCRHCGQKKVEMASTEYSAEIRHDGRLHRFTIPELKLPICEACGEKSFTEKVDKQINDALRSHLNLLTPDQIRTAIKRVHLSQKEVAQRLSIAEETISRWLNETQIQSRSLDKQLRVFFAFPQVRNALDPETQSRSLGLSDITVC